MTTDPKELIEDWMITLETENSDACTPAGTPIRSISFSAAGSIRIFLNRRRQSSSLFESASSTSAAERHWERTVARATPATSI